jgi:hypothetical protein
MRFRNIFYTIIFSAVFISCEEMSLEPNVESTFGDEYTWSFPNYAEGVLMNAYAAIPERFNSYGGHFLDVATDNAATNHFGSGMYTAAGGGINPLSNPIGDWSGPYNQFRYIHLFLENGLGDNVTYNITDETADSLHRARLKGEAYFLRAWWGFQLLQHFGGKTDEGEALGYPIITGIKPEEEMGKANDARNTYEECVQQIVADIDTAVYYLPVQYAGNNSITGITGLGRADDQVAQALKSRVLLYAASPAYQDDDITRITGMGSFNVVDPGAYEAKWVEAAQAAQEALDILVGDIPGLSAGHFTANNTPAEFVWRKYHNDRNLESLNYPPMYYGGGRTSPSQNLVDAFPAANGYPIDHPNSNYDPENPYAGRDPRLRLNVLHNGQSFIGGDPVETYKGGKDSREAHFQGTRTGYYLRKWLSIGDMLNPENPSNNHHYHALIRKTELLLNFAEASNEAVGPTATVPGTSMTAVEAIKIIRGNAGIGNHAYVDEVAGQGKDAFRKLIQNERRIELAFENHRYFDMRRWLLPLNEPVQGIEITKNADETYTYEVVEVEDRKFDDIKYYYLPIPYNEQVKSANLVNNIGW